MGTFSLSHWLVVLAIVLILFGAGRVPKARGVRAFRTGMRGDDVAQTAGERLVEAHPADQQRGEARAPSGERMRSTVRRDRRVYGHAWLRVPPQPAGCEWPGPHTLDLRMERLRTPAASPSPPVAPGCCEPPGRPQMFTPDDNLLALGSCIAGFGILVTGLLALLFRHPKAPRWTRPEIVAMLVCVPVTVTTGLGLGYTAYGLSQLVKGAGDPRELLVLLAVLIVLALVWRALDIRRRLKDYAAETGGISPSVYLTTEPTLAIDEEPPPRPKPRAPSNPRAA